MKKLPAQMAMQLPIDVKGEVLFGHKVNEDDKKVTIDGIIKEYAEMVHDVEDASAAFKKPTGLPPKPKPKPWGQQSQAKKRPRDDSDRYDRDTKRQRNDGPRDNPPQQSYGNNKYRGNQQYHGERKNSGKNQPFRPWQKNH